MENSISDSGYGTLVDYFLERGLESKNGITFITGETNEKFMSYKDLYLQALGFLCGLQKKNLEKGSELIIQIEDSERFLTALWACILGGIIPVPVTVSNNDEHKMKLLKIWNILKNPALITDKNNLPDILKFALNKGLEKECFEINRRTIFADDVDNLAGKGVVHHQPSDIAFIQFSSGSTGDPKGVTLTHSNLITNILDSIHGSQTSQNDSYLTWMPLTHDMGLIGSHLLPIVADIPQYIMPTSLFIRHPALWLAKTSQHRITAISSPNFGFRYFLNHFNEDNAKLWDLSHVRLIFNGAEPISPVLCNDFLNRMSQYGLKRNSMYTVYGFAEASLAVSFSTPGEDFVTLTLSRDSISMGHSAKDVTEMPSEPSIQLVDVGYPLENCNIRICDEENNILSDRVIGVIQIKGKNVTNGYYNNQSATNKVLSADGWLNTGDLGFLRDGHLIVTGRVKDIIFINGQNFYPYDIEWVAEEVEGVSSGRVAACGVFNNKSQKEDIILFVLHKGKIEDFIAIADRLKWYINEKMGLEIKHVLPVRKIPKTTSGKLQRYKLGESYLNGEFDLQIQEIENLGQDYGKRVLYRPINHIEEKLLEFWHEVLEIRKEDIDIERGFFELGGNSLKIWVLIAKIQAEFKINIPSEDLYKLSHFRDLAEYIEKNNNLR